MQCTIFKIYLWFSNRWKRGKSGKNQVKILSCFAHIICYALKDFVPLSKYVKQKILFIVSSQYMADILSQWKGHIKSINWILLVLVANSFWTSSKMAMIELTFCSLNADELDIQVCFGGGCFSLRHLMIRTRPEPCTLGHGDNYITASSFCTFSDFI